MTEDCVVAPQCHRLRVGQTHVLASYLAQVRRHVNSIFTAIVGRRSDNFFMPHTPPEGEGRIFTLYKLGSM